MRTIFIAKTANAITVIPPIPPYYPNNPNSHFPTAANAHRLIDSPITSAHSDRPYAALMFRKRSINHRFVCRNRLDDAEDLVVAS